MHSKIVRTAATLMLLAATAGCGGGGGVASDAPVVTRNGPTWQAVVVQPTTPVIVVPSQPVIIVVQLVPVNGFFIGAPFFFNSFIFANPGLSFACPSLLTFSSPVLIPAPAVGGTTVIQVPFVPIGIGSCVIPINLGLSGIFTLNVQVSAAPGTASTHRGYSVRVTGDWPHR